MQKAPKNNLSKLEWVAINDLKNDKNIEIKEADKGGSVAILPKQPPEVFYKKRCS